MASKNQAIAKYNEGKVASALNIASKFKLGLTDEDRDVLARGYECSKRPEQYVQMGYDCEAEVEKAVKIFETKVMGKVDEDLVENTNQEIIKKEDKLIDEETGTFSIDCLGEAFELENSRTDYGISEPVWYLIMNKKGTRDIYLSVISGNPDETLKNNRKEGYCFVCLASTDKIDRYTETGETKGISEVIKNLEKKGIVEVRSFLKALRGTHQKIECVNEKINED